MKEIGAGFAIVSILEVVTVYLHLENHVYVVLKHEYKSVNIKDIGDSVVIGSITMIIMEMTRGNIAIYIFFKHIFALRSHNSVTILGNRCDKLE